MSPFRHPTRRQLAALLASLLSSAWTRAHAAGDKPRDNGIGGTGYLSAIPDRDNGIGGTGVVGTIRAFGSVIVNGLRVSYPVDAEVPSTGAKRASAICASAMWRHWSPNATGRKSRRRKFKFCVRSSGRSKVSDHGLRVLGQDGRVRPRREDEEDRRLFDRPACRGERPAPAGSDHRREPRRDTSSPAPPSSSASSRGRRIDDWRSARSRCRASRKPCSASASWCAAR